jgi:hypothetical protein
MIQVASVLFNYSCVKSLDTSGIAGRRVQISNSPTRYFYTFQLFRVHLATKFAPPLQEQEETGNSEILTAHIKEHLLNANAPG